MRTVRRLRLRGFSFYDYRCRAVHSVTCCPVESMQAHHKDCAIPFRNSAIISITVNIFSFITILMVDLGGFAPPSRTLFSLLRTAITYNVTIILYKNRFAISLNGGRLCRDIHCSLSKISPSSQ